MTNRRGSRPTHVRPRPPSSGRPAPVKSRPRAPAPGRLSAHSPIRRSRGIPIVGRLALAAAVVAIAVGVLYVGAGGLGTVAAAVRGTLSAFIDDVTATPVPSATPVTVSDAPSLESPREPYTNQEQVDLEVIVPTAIAGRADYRIRVYLALQDQSAAPIEEVGLAPTARTTIPVTLTKGINDFSVTLVGPGGESEASPLVRWVLDQTKPSIKLNAPKDGAVINRKAVTLEGRTQARTTLTAKNLETNQSITATAANDGTFSLSLPITKGSNPIRINATDPAGNVNAAELTVTRGSGELRASLSLSSVSIKRANLPEEIRLTVTVDDPDGKPIEGARVTFTLDVPGIKIVKGEARTDKNGRAVFVTTIPAGADLGGGTAGVLVRTAEHGQTTDETGITIRK
jgi:hypothetical protein